MVGQSRRFWVNDDFTDNDTAGWSLQDADNDATIDGSVSASSGTLAFTGVVSVSGSPDSGTGAILLFDDEARQDVRITCDVTLSAGCENAGVVFGYVDNQNYWVKVFSDTSDTAKTYQISAGTWTEKASNAKTITTGTEFEMNLQVRAGQADGYAATVPVGRVGLWCSDSSDNSFDDFVVRDLAGPFDASTHWFSTIGDVQIDESGDNVLTSVSKNGTGTATTDC